MIIEDIIESLKEDFGEDILETGSSVEFKWVKINRGILIPICQILKDKGFKLLVDIMSVDNSERERKSRYTVLYNLFHPEEGKRFGIKIDIEQEESLPSVIEVWAGADWMEREVYDMMGIEFESHPNLERILNYEDIPGYPLRKEFPLRPRNVPWERPE